MHAHAGARALVVGDPGAFLAHGVTVNYGSARYYGSGESFLVSFHNGRPQDLAIYTWTQANDLFTLSR